MIFGASLHPGTLIWVVDHEVNEEVDRGSPLLMRRGRKRLCAPFAVSSTVPDKMSSYRSCLNCCPGDGSSDFHSAVSLVWRLRQTFVNGPALLLQVKFKSFPWQTLFKTLSRSARKIWSGTACFSAFVTDFSHQPCLLLLTF